MKKLKVGLFIDTWYPMVDGVIMVVDNYAKRLNKFCDVTVFTVNARGKDTTTHEYNVVKCKSLPILSLDYDIPLAKLDRKFKQELDKSKLDIVHIHSPFFIGKMGVQYAKKNNIPVVATMHSQYKQDFYKATHSKMLTKMLLKNIMNVFNKCDEYYAVNEKIAEIFYGYGSKHMPLVQRNGTDFTFDNNKLELSNTINDMYNLKKNEKVFLFVGRLIKLKNIFFILDSLKILKEKGMQFKMFYVGSGPDSERLSAKIKEYKMEDCVILTGKITDRNLMKAFYARANLFLFPSLYDASSLVQIEAASQKTPTLFIKDAPTSYTITAETNGYISDNDVNKYAEKILQIFSNEKHHDQICENAQRDLHITWDDCVSEMYNKYIEIIKNKGEKNE